MPERVESASRPADVAVVIVNYNSGDDVTRAARSALEAAGDARVEVVVVDNASRDGSAERAEGPVTGLRVVRSGRAAAAVTRWRVSSGGGNAGFGSAATVGMRATRTPWVFLLNPDARITGGTL